MNTALDIKNESLDNLIAMLPDESRKLLNWKMRKQLATALEKAGIYTPATKIIKEKKAENQGAPWFAIQDERLRYLYETEKKGAREIAKSEKRTEAGITARVVRLGMENNRQEVRR